MSSVLFGKGPEKQSCRLCTTASHYQSHLPTFVFAFSFPTFFLPSCFSLIVSLLLSPPLLSFLLTHSCFCPFLVLLALLSLTLSHYCSSMFSAVFFVRVSPSFIPYDKKLFSGVSAQSWFPSSFILSANNSACLVFAPLQTCSHRHTHNPPHNL